MNNMLLKLVIDGVGYYQHCINGNVGDIFTNWKDIKYQNDLLLLKIRKSEERKQNYENFKTSVERTIRTK